MQHNFKEGPAIDSYMTIYIYLGEQTRHNGKR